MEIRPDILGVTVLMDQYAQAGHEVARLTKETNEAIYTLIGGVYPTVNPHTATEDKNIDFVFQGEAELTFKNLVLHLMGHEVSITDGISYYDGDLFVDKGHSDLIKDLDSIPLPAYDLIDFHSYTNTVSDRKTVDAPDAYPYARIVTSRGCPFSCTFCQVPSIQGRYFRRRSTENIIQEIKWLKESYGIKSIVFDDDNLYTNPKLAKELFREMISNNLIMPWVSIATAVFRLDEEMLDLMYQSGCRYIDVAIESGSKRVIEEIVLKPINHQRALELIKYAKSLGIFVAGNVILGFPGETWEEILESIKYAEVADFDYVKMFNAMPLKNTVMYEKAVELDMIQENNSNNWVKGGAMSSMEFDSIELSILRAFEWDRINFTNREKKLKIASRMHISEEELDAIRKKTRLQCIKTIKGHSYPAV